MNENRCVYCGEIIPEGRQVCPSCEKIQSETTKAEVVDRLLNFWILPLGMVALIVMIVMFVLKTG